MFESYICRIEKVVAVTKGIEFPCFRYYKNILRNQFGFCTILLGKTLKHMSVLQASLRANVGTCMAHCSYAIVFYSCEVELVPESWFCYIVPCNCWGQVWHLSSGRMPVVFIIMLCSKQNLYLAICLYWFAECYWPRGQSGRFYFDRFCCIMF